ncbi:hypothetical protein BD414DRAFT_307750 [Trametes punicea]|nr:hypothetical protein BD414DRAFT_307750 [Trametes punicea]
MAVMGRTRVSFPVRPPSQLNSDRCCHLSRRAAPAYMTARWPRLPGVCDVLNIPAAAYGIAVVRTRIPRWPSCPLEDLLPTNPQSPPLACSTKTADIWTDHAVPAAPPKHRTRSLQGPRRAIESNTTQRRRSEHSQHARSRSSRLSLSLQLLLEAVVHTILLYPFPCATSDSARSCNSARSRFRPAR